MKIKRKVSQHRRDTWLIYECQGCGHVTPEESGYDDDNFYLNVIPNKKCAKCGKSSIDLGIINDPVATKYASWQII